MTAEEEIKQLIAELKKDGDTWLIPSLQKRLANLPNERAAAEEAEQNGEPARQLPEPDW